MLEIFSFLPLGVAHEGSAAFRAGVATGMIAMFLGPLMGGIWCLRLRQKPNFNGKGGLALAFTFFGLAINSLASALIRVFPVLEAFRTLAVIVFAIFLLAAFVLAVLAMADFHVSGKKFSSGGLATLSALVISSFILSLFNFVAARQALEVAHAVTASFSEEGDYEYKILPRELVSFEEYNFRFEVPPEPWRRIEKNEINPDSCLVLTRSNPEIFFVIIADNEGIGPSVTNRDLARSAQANLERVAHPSPYQEDSAWIDGKETLHFQTVADMGGKSFFYDYHVFTFNGYAYQLIAWSKASDQQPAIKALDALFPKFSIMDEGKNAFPVKSLPDFVSKDHAYTISLSGEQWREWPTVSEYWPGAEFGVISEEHQALLIIPMNLFDIQPEVENVTAAFLDSLGWEDTSGEILKRQVVTDGVMPSLSMVLEKEVNGNPYQYQIQILTTSDHAYFVAAYGLKDDSFSAEKLQTLLKRVSFESASRDVGTSLLSGASSVPWPKRNAAFLNDLGLSLLEHGDFDQGQASFLRAFELHPAISLYLENAVFTRSQTGDYQGALDLLESHHEDFPYNLDLACQSAELLANLGKTDRALETYEHIFDSTSDYASSHFNHYLELLITEKHFNQALEEIEQQLRTHNILELVLLKARVLRLLEDYDGAVTILKKQRLNFPYRTDIVFQLMETLQAAGQGRAAYQLYEEAILNKLTQASENSSPVPHNL